MGDPTDSKRVSLKPPECAVELVTTGSAEPSSEGNDGQQGPAREATSAKGAGQPRRGSAAEPRCACAHLLPRCVHRWIPVRDGKGAVGPTLGAQGLGQRRASGRAPSADYSHGAPEQDYQGYIGQLHLRRGPERAARTRAPAVGDRHAAPPQGRVRQVQGARPAQHRVRHSRDGLLHPRSPPPPQHPVGVAQGESTVLEPAHARRAARPSDGPPARRGICAAGGQKRTIHSFPRYYR